MASGSFTFDSALDGSVLDYGDLSAFSFTFAGTGFTYDLAFVNNNSFLPNRLNFEFDTATDSFVFATAHVSGSPLVALTTNFQTGFRVNSSSSITEFILGVNSGSFGFNSVPTTRTTDPAPVPEPGTLTLLGAGLAGVIVRRRLRPRCTRV